MRYLAGDIGGTKTLLALFLEREGHLVLERQEKFVSHKYQSLEQIISLFLKGEKGKIDRACFGIAGPIEEGICRATNLPWIIKAQEIAKGFSIADVFLINDLKANAYGLQTLKEKDFYLLHKGKEQKKENQALISAGTGLGESPIFFTGEELVPSASEGGHADFAPRNELEIELLKSLLEKYGHVSIERVLSGQGIVTLYNFLITKGIEKQKEEVVAAMQKEDPAKVISTFALNGKCKACKTALQWFCSLYGAEAGNLALKVMALGGIYIGGGIAPKILPLLKESDFLKSFFEKGRFTDLLKGISVYIVLDETTALRGSAYFCQKNVNQYHP